MFSSHGKVGARPIIKAMRNLRIPIRVVFYQEDGRWIAHCLEFDLIGDGEAKEQALKVLGQAIEAQVEASVRHGGPKSLFTPADGRLFEMFAAGTDVAAGELQMQLKLIQIEKAALREYIPEPGELPVCAYA